MNIHTITLPAAIAALTLTTLPVLTSCAGSKPLGPLATAAVSQLKEAVQAKASEHACGEYVAKVHELSKGVGLECLEIVRTALQDRAIATNNEESS